MFADRIIPRFNRGVMILLYWSGCHVKRNTKSSLVVIRTVDCVGADCVLAIRLVRLRQLGRSGLHHTQRTDQKLVAVELVRRGHRNRHSQLRAFDHLFVACRSYDLGNEPLRLPRHQRTAALAEWSVGSVVGPAAFRQQLCRVDHRCIVPRSPSAN